MFLASFPKASALLYVTLKDGASLSGGLSQGLASAHSSEVLQGGGGGSFVKKAGLEIHWHRLNSF
jgi:hypothetical protein